MALRIGWFGGAVVVVLSSLCLASVQSGATEALVSLEHRERQSWNAAVHDSEFNPMTRVSSRPACGAVQPPEALATPDPLLEQVDSSSKASVSFIVGTDGRVHSALILESAGPNEDRVILDAVRLWRYRPALCNGVPTEAEAKVEFSNR